MTQHGRANSLAVYRGLVIGGCVLVVLGMLTLGGTRVAGAGQPSVDNPSQPYAPSLHGKAVSFGLRGLEPDFDPIYSTVIVATLHDSRPAHRRLPDTTLILDCYLENFQPDTTPLLPDLLNPAVPAANVVGFMQGKSVLVNAAGKIAYRGTMLAEVFRDDTMHLVIAVEPVGTQTSTSSSLMHMGGILVLRKGGTQVGNLVAQRGLTFPGLAVAQGSTVPWQSVVRGLEVHLPPMMGTAGHCAVDTQAMSFDAYNKFIEDDFLSGVRLDPSIDGRPDGRRTPQPLPRETAMPTVGGTGQESDLVNDFSFGRSVFQAEPTLPAYATPGTVYPTPDGTYCAN